MPPTEYFVPLHLYCIDEIYLSFFMHELKDLYLMQHHSLDEQPEIPVHVRGKSMSIFSAVYFIENKTYF